MYELEPVTPNMVLVPLLTDMCSIVSGTILRVTAYPAPVRAQDLIGRGGYCYR